MDFGLLINSLPLWLLFAITLAVTTVSVEIGACVAHFSLRGKPKDPEAPVGSLVAAMLGLVAFLLAFTFGMTMSRLDARKQLVLQESNAIGTTYLRAGLLPAEQRMEIRKLLRDYVDVRLTVTLKELPRILKRSDEIHGRLWKQAESLMTTDMDSEIRALFIDSLNDVIDLHESRKTVALLHRIPGMVWATLYLLSILAMTLIGYQIGMAGSRRLRGSPVLAAALSLVIVMIADVDRPGEGQFQVDLTPLKDVQQMMLSDVQSDSAQSANQPQP